MQLGNHLGNVLVTISDKKKRVADPLNAALIKFFESYMLSGTDYYPFGMAMRIGGDSSYRYGFNGLERSNEIKGEGNSYTAKYWEYDSRIGRRWNLDPMYNTDSSRYAVNGNNPNYFLEPNEDSIIKFGAKCTNSFTERKVKLNKIQMKVVRGMESGIYTDPVK